MGVLMGTRWVIPSPARLLMLVGTSVVLVFREQPGYNISSGMYCGYERTYHSGIN
jgi:hypothetical protein